MDKASTLALVREQAFQRKPQRFGRGGIPKNRLLDDSDNNIGNSSIINPAEAQSIFVQTNPTRLLALDALSPTGQMVSVSMTNRFITDPPPAFGGSSMGGPIIGIVEFGNGSVATRVEMDVPLGRVDFTGAEAQDGVTAMSVPAGTLRVYARNDGNLIPSTIFGQPQGIAQGVAVSNNIANYAVTAGDPSIARSTLVKAHTAYFTRPAATRGPSRTVWVYVGNGVVVGAPVPFITAGVDVFGAMTIPPFSKKVRIIRIPEAADLTLSFFAPTLNTALPFETHTIVGGAPSQTIDVPSQAIWFSVESVAVGDVISLIAAEFEIGT